LCHDPDMDGEPDECRRWAIEAIKSGVTPADVVAELRLRRGLSPIPTIKIMREAAGIGLAEAKLLVDQTMSPEFIASRDQLIDEAIETFMTELTVEGATITLSRPRDGGQWTLELAADGIGACSNDYLVGNHSVDDAEEKAAAVIDRLSRRNGIPLEVAWAAGAVNTRSLGRFVPPDEHQI
jgi:ribosomal protein L7/L12